MSIQSKAPKRTRAKKVEPAPAETAPVFGFEEEAAPVYSPTLAGPPVLDTSLTDLVPPRPSVVPVDSKLVDLARSVHSIEWLMRIRHEPTKPA